MELQMVTKRSAKRSIRSTQEKELNLLPDEMQRIHAESRANLIAKLEVGESFATASRLELDSTSKADIDAMKANLSSTMSKAANQAAKRSGNTYVTEIGDFMTRSVDIVLAAVVTRVA